MGQVSTTNYATSFPDRISQCLYACMPLCLFLCASAYLRVHVGFPKKGLNKWTSLFLTALSWRLSPCPHRLLDYMLFYRHPSNPSDSWQIMKPRHFTEQVCPSQSKSTHWHLGLFVTPNKQTQAASLREFTVISRCCGCVRTDCAQEKKSLFKSTLYVPQSLQHIHWYESFTN